MPPGAVSVSIVNPCPKPLYVLLPSETVGAMTLGRVRVTVAPAVIVVLTIVITEYSPLAPSAVETIFPYIKMPATVCPSPATR